MVFVESICIAAFAVFLIALLWATFYPTMPPIPSETKLVYYYIPNRIMFGTGNVTRDLAASSVPQYLVLVSFLIAWLAYANICRLHGIPCD